MRGRQAERKKENNHKIRAKRENEQWNEGKKGEMKRKGLLKSGNRERANIFDENATLASTV